MHEFKPRVGGYEACGCVQAGMVRPLVLHAQGHAGDFAVAHFAESCGILRAWVFFAGAQVFAQMQVLTGLQLADRILGQDDHAERADGLGNAVVDFRVDVVGTPGEHDAVAVVLFHVGERAQALLLDIMLEQLVFCVRRLDRLLRLLHRHVRPGEFFDDALGHELMIGQVEVGAHVADARFA